MFWQEILFYLIFVIGILLAIAFVMLELHIMLNSDLINRSLKMKQALNLTEKPIFEKDEEDSKIIHFYPKHK